MNTQKLIARVRRESQERVAELEAEVVVLRGALEPFLKRFRLLDKSWGGNEPPWSPEAERPYSFRAGDIRHLLAALAQPSPTAEAVRAVVDAAIRAEKAHIEYMELLGTSTKLPNVQIEKVSKEMDVADKELEKAIAAYLALRDGRADGGWNDSETKVQVS